MDYYAIDDKFADLTIDNDIHGGTDLGDWTPPGADLVQKLVSQIEYYLSDENLARDAFLLKHLKRNRMGYVNIKLLTSFKKMKPLTKDWRTAAYALRQSLKLELNQEGTKVRRKDPVPDSLSVPTPSKSLLLWNLQEPYHEVSRADPPRSSLECAITMLSPFGDISTARVVRAGRELPPEIRRYASRYPELRFQDCVLVEYEDVEAAGGAYRELSQATGPARVVLLRKSSGKMAYLDRDQMDNGHRPKSVDVLRRRARILDRGDDSSQRSSPSPTSQPHH